MEKFGVPLEEYIKNGNNVLDDDVLVKKLINTLRGGHSKQMVHANLNKENILVDAQTKEVRFLNWSSYEFTHNGAEDDFEPLGNILQISKPQLAALLRE